MNPRLHHPLVAHFGSVRLTLAAFGLLAAVVLARPAWWPLWGVVGVLAVNLLCALVTRPALRRQVPLLVAHGACVVGVVLIAAGRMMALDGRFELTEGVPFDGHLIDRQSGPLYQEALQRLSFEHTGFAIDYAPGRQRGATRNAVRWRDEDGVTRVASIGDHRPLIIDGHRIYTSPNKGFAPVLRWQPAAGEAVLGAVHLPSYPMHELRQSREWSLPDGRPVWVMLQFDETLIDARAASTFKLPGRHTLVVRLGEQRLELAPGQSWTVAGGTLTYVGLRTWMGYRIAYDPTLLALLVTALVAALAMATHYLLKFRGGAATQRAISAAEVSHG